MSIDACSFLFIKLYYYDDSAYIAQDGNNPIAPVSPLLYEISAQFATSGKQYLAHTFISHYKLSPQAVTNYMYMFLFLKIKTKIIKSAASLDFDKVKDPIWLLQCLLEERCLFLTTACTLQLLLPAAGTHQVRPHPPTPWPSCACDESWSCLLLLLLQQEQ